MPNQRMLLIDSGVVGVGSLLIPVESAQFVEVADTFKGTPENVVNAISAGFVTAYPVGKRVGKAPIAKAK